MKTKLPKDQMDKECIALCEELNRLPGINTDESCCGHLKEPYRIFFTCRNLRSLAIIARAVDRRYCATPMGWRIIAETGDRMPCYNFLLESKGAFDDLEAMVAQVQTIINNIEYWRGKEFRRYFRRNG